MTKISTKQMRSCADELDHCTSSAGKWGQPPDIYGKSAQYLRRAADKLDEISTRANGWLPIKSAPKDGTEILLAEFSPDGIGRSGYVYRAARWHYHVGFCKDGRFWECSFYDGYTIGTDELITHWMPLPTPPKVDE